MHLKSFCLRCWQWAEKIVMRTLSAKEIGYRKTTLLKAWQKIGVTFDLDKCFDFVWVLCIIVWRQKYGQLPGNSLMDCRQPVSSPDWLKIQNGYSAHVQKIGPSQRSRFLPCWPKGGRPCGRECQQVGYCNCGRFARLTSSPRLFVTFVLSGLKTEK